jgi:hypothetical protein
MFSIILCTLLILVLVYVLCIRKPSNENFGDPLSVRKTADILDMSQQFEDMIVYDNQLDGRMGLDRCVEHCKGYCVENGQTGSAFCFPVRKPVVKDYYGMIVQNEQKLSFPNL